MTDKDGVDDFDIGVMYEQITGKPSDTPQAQEVIAEAERMANMCKAIGNLVADTNEVYGENRLNLRDILKVMATVTGGFIQNHVPDSLPYSDKIRGMIVFEVIENIMIAAGMKIERQRKT